MRRSSLPELPRRATPATAIGLLHIAALVLFFQSYSIVRSLVAGTPATAYAHARTVLHIESVLHLPSEQRLQALVLRHPTWCTAANLYYGSVHFVVPAVVFVYLYRRARWRYGAAARAFVTINVASLAVFAIWPLMPPRLLPTSYGFVDVGSRFAGLPVDRALASGPGNGFAAMPSLHAAFAVWSVWAVWPFLTRRLRQLAIVYPFVTGFVVIATANHYWLDIFGGALLCAVVTASNPVAHTAPAAASPSALTALYRCRVACIAGLAGMCVYWESGRHTLNAIVAGTLVFGLAVTLDRPARTTPAGERTANSRRHAVLINQARSMRVTVLNEERRGAFQEEVRQ